MCSIAFCIAVQRVVLTSIGIDCLPYVRIDLVKQRVDRTTDPVDSSADGEEAVRTAGAANDESVTILYTTLQKLAFNHAVNMRSAGADVGLLRCLQADCRAVGASPELRDAAAELLLQLSTPNAASATPT